MLEKLKEVSKKSYSPYSNFKVAVILENETGETYGGANIENIAFPSSMCAERVAISVALMSGVDLKGIVNVHIFSPDADFTLPPCGGCRQVLTEHLNINTNIYMYSKDGTNTVMTLNELVPMAILSKSFLGNK